MKTQHTPTPYSFDGHVIKAKNGQRLFKGDGYTDDTLLEALNLAISALNQIPNAGNLEHGTTYKLLTVLESTLKLAKEG